MSWLYSIVFAGLLFSSADDNAPFKAIEKAVTGPAPVQQTRDETEKFEQTYPLTANGRVSVSNINGSITIEAWDRNEVHLEVTKIADSRETLAEVEVEVSSRPTSLSIETDYTNMRHSQSDSRHNNRRLEVHFRLSVPRAADLREIETVNGSINVSNLVNVTKVSAVNGDITAANLRGAADLSTVNGVVNADFDQLETGSRINLSTVNGSVKLFIPSDSNATVKADSLNGQITNDFGLPVKKGEFVGRDLHGRIGSGDVQIKLNSVNGELSIKRKNDGRNLNPATNMLPQNGSGDWDFDTSRLNATVNREVARAVRGSKREAAVVAQRSKQEAVKALSEMENLKLEEYEALKALQEIDLENLPAVKLEDLPAEQKEILKKTLKQALELKVPDMSRLTNAYFSVTAPTIEKKRNSFTVKGTPTVDVEAEGCDVNIRGWDKQEVQYVVTEIAGRLGGDPVGINEHITESGLELRVKNTNEIGGPFVNRGKRVRIEVYVPRKSNLKITTDGEIRLEGVSGDVELNGEDSSINVRDVDGKLRLAANDGLVRVIGFKGELSTKTVDSDVFLEGDFKQLSAKAADGNITLTLPEDTNADVTSNAEVVSEGIIATRKSSQNWTLGSGGNAKYNFDLVDGKLFIRNAALINSY